MWCWVEKGLRGKEFKDGQKFSQSPTMPRLAMKEEGKATVMGKGQLLRSHMRPTDVYLFFKPESGTFQTCLTSTFSEF